MTSSYESVGFVVQTTTNEKIKFHLNELLEFAEEVSVPLIDSVDSIIGMILVCKSVHELTELIPNLVSVDEVMETVDDDEEIEEIVAEKTAKFSKKMQALGDISNISCIKIVENTNATGAAAPEVAEEYCDAEVMDKLEEACDGEDEFKKIQNMISGYELAVFDANIITTIYLSDDKTTTAYAFSGETAYGQDGFNLTIGDVDYEDLFEEDFDEEDFDEEDFDEEDFDEEGSDEDDSDDSDESAGWESKLDWALRGSEAYEKELEAAGVEPAEIKPDSSGNVPIYAPHIPRVIRKAEEGDELALRYISVLENPF